MNTTEILTEELINLIENLRFAGYNIGATQHIAAQDLILTLAAQGQLPSELTELREFLAPILCHSPKEQNEFATHFNQWVSQFPQTKIVASFETQTSPQTQITPKIETITPQTQITPKIETTTPKTQIIPKIETSTEIETKPLNDLESELRTIKKGHILWKWAFIAFAMVFLSSVFVYWADIINLFKDDEVVQTIQRNNDEIFQPKPMPDDIQTVISSWDVPELQLIGILLSPLLILLLWQFWRWYRAQLFLKRKTTTALPESRKLFVKGRQNDKFFQSVGLARTAQQLRQHISISANLLDITATIERTLQAGGWFTPITGRIKTRPEYLALIDRTTFHDHQTQFINSLINQLTDDEVLVTRYYFDTVPRRCYPEHSQRAPLTLTELAQHYPDHRLLIFSDGNGLINPITIQVVDWIEQFSVWAQRALFTLESPEQWGYREQLLEAANFWILPANEAGFKGLVERINSGTWQLSVRGDFSQFPEYLNERPRRWLEHHAPDKPVLIELLKQVRDFLGDKAYYWFSACAIYPELRWHLTLYLGEHLELLTAEGLAKLARLPWFRYGYMPDWLRLQLIKDLSLPQEREIRTTLYNRLLEISEQPLSDCALEIAKAQPNTVSLLAQRLLAKWTKQAPKNSPLHDHVFMTFMGDKLAVKIPKIWRNLLQSKRLPSLWSRLWLKSKTEVIESEEITESEQVTESREEITESEQVTESREVQYKTFEFKVVTVNERGEITQRTRKKAKYYTENLGNGVTLDMVSIRGGTFMMGSPETEKNRSGDESPQHPVTVASFFMSKYPVTQAQWEAVMGNNPSYFKGKNRPVEQVSWNNAIEFCQRLSEKTGHEYRLPSEAEWEYACRTGTTTPFYFGDTITTNLANYNGNNTYASGPRGIYRQKTTEVGSFPPNAFGLYDMHGNVWEWCADIWHKNYNGAPTDGSAWKSDGDGSLFVLRGSSWINDAWRTRSASRNGGGRSIRDRDYGFRLAR